MRARRDPKNKVKKRKRYTKKPKQVTSHVFAETTHDIAAPYGFACVVVHRRSYIFHVSEPLGVEICPFPLLWLLSYTTACTVSVLFYLFAVTYTKQFPRGPGEARARQLKLEAEAKARQWENFRGKARRRPRQQIGERGEAAKWSNIDLDNSKR